MKGLDSHALWAKICGVLALGHVGGAIYGSIADSRVAALWGIAGTLTWSAATVAFWIKARQDQELP